MRTGRRAAAAVVLCALVVGGAAAPAVAAGIEREPTSADLAAQQRRTAQLRERAETAARSVDDARRALSAAGVLAAQALEQRAVAVRNLSVQQAQERSRLAESVRAQQDVDRSRAQLGRWARESYRAGSGLGSSATVTAVLESDTGADLGTNLTVLRRLGRDRTRVLDDVRSAARRADASADAAATASERAASSAIAASSAGLAAEVAVARQRRLLAIAESSATGMRHEAEVSATRELELRTRLADARQAYGWAGASRTGRTNDVIGAVGSCAGGAVGQYPNGRIPVAALCGLATAPGHYLRADAAYAFDRLSHAFALRFGVPICVTDSYRTYAGQVALYARKPALAAVPGTSNHGWGTAVDLCGGIQSFGTDEHRWLLLNATLYGWFHPAWAEPNGTRPEAWHWEYGG